ncbi:MAG TPA: hypothetical protein VEP90_02255, partial [Methylomirabilota bacterium]|nr:hypothetical protein [Methylomirabilota bacterium]
SQFGKVTEKPSLRLSKMGPSCPRALWYSIHKPELAEPLPAWAEIKYSFGHILEALAIALAKAAGHEVLGEQDAVVVDGVVGHRDCVIDGCIVDVKSSSSRGFIKFKNGLLEKDDSFGYLDQLDGYLVGSLGDPLVRDKEHGYILAIDKQLGHMCLYEHTIREEKIRRRIEQYKGIVQRILPPVCECKTRETGKSGNVELGIRESYSPYKWGCFPQLRCFLYADGPKYLTKVVRKPDVPEVNKEGQIVYNS